MVPPLLPSAKSQPSCQRNPVTKPSGHVYAPTSFNSTPPLATCKPFLPSAPCSQFVSILGTSNGVNLPWVAAGGLRVELYSVNGVLQFAAKTPCNPISGPATITGNTHHTRQTRSWGNGLRRRVFCAGAMGHAIPESPHRNVVRPRHSDLDERRGHPPLQKQIAAARFSFSMPPGGIPCGGRPSSITGSSPTRFQTAHVWRDR